MSGFEIAGVVLGSFPLLISACEHYKKGFEPLVKWKRFRSDFIGFIDAVDAERLLFDQMLERFLLSTDAVDHDELQCFKSDPNYNGWKRKDLKEILSRRLGPSLAVFTSSIKTMHALIQDLQHILLLKNGEVDWAAEGASKWDYQLKRIHLSFSKKGTKLVAALETHNRKLRELLDSNEKLEIVKSSQKDTSWANIFDSIRKHASSIHAAIKNGFCCGCPPHWTALRLETRKQEKGPSNFYLAFSIPKNNVKGNSMRREVVMTLKEQGIRDTKSLSLAPVQFQGGSLETNLSTLRYNFESKSTSQLDVPETRPSLISSVSGPTDSSGLKFKDRFTKGILGSSMRHNRSVGDINNVNSNFQTMTVDAPLKVKKHVKVLDGCVTPTPRPISMVTNEPDVPCPKIDNLCYTMMNTPNDSGSDLLGYLCDGQEEHEVRHFHASEVGTEDPYISLERLLSGTGDIKLSRQQRYTLASVLASSLLQLQTTPWLVQTLNKSNIFFYRKDGQVALEYPYIKHVFPSINSTGLNSHTHRSEVDRFAVRNSLSNFGILLLELCFGETIESQEFRKRYLGPDGKPLEFTDYLTARDWAELVVQEEPAFEQVVKCCVFCTFNEKADWENKRFTQAVHSSVVAPLEKLHGKWSIF